MASRSLVGGEGDITPGGEPLTHITEIKDHDLSLGWDYMGSFEFRPGFVLCGPDNGNDNDDVVIYNNHP